MSSPQYSVFNDSDLQLLDKITNNLAILAGASGQYPNWYDTKDQLIQKIVNNLGAFAATGGGGSSSNGEIIANATQSGPVAILNNVPKTIQTLVLPAGVWLVTGRAGFNSQGGDALIDYVEASLSLVNNTPDYTGQYADLSIVAGTSVGMDILQSTAILTLVAPTTIYLVMDVSFAANAVNTFGYIFAQRVPSITLQ